MLQNIPDLMVSMAELDEDSIQRVRRTAETPPRVSVYDVLGAITGYAPEDRHKLFQRLCDQFPEVRTICTNFKFPGRGQRDRYFVATAEQLRSNSWLKDLSF